MALNNHLYQATGFTVNYKEGDRSSQRERINFLVSADDKLHTIIDDDNLTQLAYRYYGDPILWYIIADANDIENPFELTTGGTLQIPSPAQFGNFNKAFQR